MDVDDDVLFLFITSHGSSSGLALSFPERTPFENEVLEPAGLRAMLDEAGIKWRIIVITGCESGVFVDGLGTDESIVFTAAANDRFSYGCANGRAFTDFGRTVFEDELPRTRSFVEAFRNAVTRTEQREAEQRVRPSKPRLFVGGAIARKLEARP
jgi:hypothetical protein